MITTGTAEFTIAVNGQPMTGLRNIVHAPQTVNDFGLNSAIYGLRNIGKTLPCYTLYGVQYSPQPVGPLRWKPSSVLAPAAPIDARYFGPVPPQGYSEEGSDYGKGRSDLGTTRGLSSWAELRTREGEACLNANWYLPDLDVATKKPVIVDFHGGGSNYLSANDDRMAGFRLAVEGVIHVRVNTRLGNVGHFYLPGMEDEPDYQGVNFGVLDAITFLTWLQNHGSDIGCDITNVTIRGGSAGGNLCLVLLAHPTARDLFQHVNVSSPSGGINIRYEAEANSYTPGYKAVFAARKTAYLVMFPRLRSTIFPEKTLAQVKADLITAGATENEAFAEVMREHLSLQDFLGFDEGATNQQLYYSGYQATRSLTIMNDGETCFHQSNLAAALAGAYPGTHEVIITVAENEASVIGGGDAGNLNFPRELHDLCHDTPQQWSRSPVYNTEFNGTAGTPTWGAISNSQRYLPWGTATEPNRMIFNHGYQYTAYCVARAVEAAGGTAYLNLYNVKPAGTLGGRVGHTADEPAWVGNALWAFDPPGIGGVEPLTEIFIRFTDTMVKMLANFSKSGDPNTPWAVGFDLYATPPTLPLTPFNPTDGNWNVVGLPYRSAGASPLTITNTPNFWGHAWDYYDSKRGI